MNKLIVLAMLLLAAAAVAQEPAAPASTPPSDMEPGVNTSAPAAAPQPVQSVAPQSTKPAAAKPAQNAAANKPASRGNAKDRLDLESTQITGNRELPKVLYIVPWRSAEMGDLVGRPVNSLLDEVLEPVDRDVFRRQNRYFEALQPNEAAQPKQPEK